MVHQNIVMYKGFNGFDWRVVRQAAKRDLAVTESIAVEAPRGVRKQALAWIDESGLKRARVIEKEVIKATGKYEPEAHRVESVDPELISSLWRGEQIERREIIRMNPGNVRALDFFARQSIERLASSARQLMMDSTLGTNNS